MIVLQDTNERETVQFAQQLYRDYSGKAASFERTAGIVVDKIYHEFCQPDGNPLFALLRIFRFSTHADMHPELQPLATADSKYWLMLMASMGIEPDWCDRRKSKGHQVIPADSPVTPMLQAAFAQIGLSFGAEIASSGLEMHDDRDYKSLQYFHIPAAEGSPYVPAQADFVVPYGIQSVIGVGSPFRGNSAYICIGFATDSITTDEAERFARINPYIGTLLAQYNEEVIWG